MQSIGKAFQRGFSLLEISVAMAVILLLAITGIPAIGHYVIESKVPKVGEGLARFIVQAKVNAMGVDPAPYRGIDTALFAHSVRDSSVFSVLGTGAGMRILHGLGDKGEVRVAERVGGGAFAITLTRVNDAACPSIASVMQRVADTISIEAEGRAAKVVKAEQVPFNAMAARAHCGRGNSNTFIFGIG
ncbi:type 4 pilus major pilin [Allopusillimonas ginsengisoli]|uniref:type 4 pilus major pilin n=1 Tax=Allopusillimonas ginsengisoli TaxID=453575 RepID=UPI0010228367|nr:type 4 pilus major pilin [Allopusillimonas ginsengisoli]TEA77340.1 prepilin-type N-terminal cleavage/methylation domain-containing protein [Allopusillimonas ginsengisoli]